MLNIVYARIKHEFSGKLVKSFIYAKSIFAEATCYIRKPTRLMRGRNKPQTENCPKSLAASNITQNERVKYYLHNVQLIKH